MKFNLLKIMDDLDIKYRYLEHEPVVDYESARFVDEKYNLEGVESKNLFLKGKSGNYYVMVSIEGMRFDRKFMKELLGEKVSISSPSDLISITGYEVGCATSFGYDKDIKIIVDEQIFDYDAFICSAGTPTTSYVMKCEDLKKVYKSIENEVLYVSLPKA
ncbi:MAG: YbaK/EbsC family protein [Erysipelotrichaceae bacterium]